MMLFGGVIPSPEGKRSMRKLAQRMVSSFCTSINNNNNDNLGINSGGHQWTTLNNNKGGTGSNIDELEVRATIHKTTDPGQPNGVVLSAATTIWLPFPPLSLFNFFRDERTRHQWDVLSNQNPFQDIAHIANGSHPGNCISLLRTGAIVAMKSMSDASKTVAKGILNSLKPSDVVGGTALGKNWCEVLVQVVVEDSKCLIRPYDMFYELRDVLGCPVACPYHLVIVDDE